MPSRDRETNKTAVLTQRLTQLTWGDELSALPWWRALLLRWARMLWLLGRELIDGQLSMRAMSLVYTTLLSLIPLLAVSFSVLKAFGVHNQIEPALQNFLTPLGTRGEEISATIISFVDNVQVGVLGAVGLGLLFYTVVSLLQKVERAFNYAWQVSQHRPFVERFSDYLSVLLVGPVLVFSALGATASFMSSGLVVELTSVPVLGWMIQTVGRLIPYVFIIAAFTFVYVFVPNTRVRVGAALVGALVAGVLWQTIGWGFASFVVNSTKYAAIYSGFAILILFMIWLYLAWLILLVGASIAFYQQHPEYLRLSTGGTSHIGNRQRERLGLLAMCLIAKRHFQGAPAPSANLLARELRMPMVPVADVLALLLDKGLIIAVGSTPETYLPGRAPERIEVQAVLDVLRRSDEKPDPLKCGPTPGQSVAEILAMLERVSADALNGLTVRDLVLERGLPDQQQAVEKASAE
jgi:membrane protein